MLNIVRINAGNYYFYIEWQDSSNTSGKILNIQNTWWIEPNEIGGPVGKFISVKAAEEFLEEWSCEKNILILDESNEMIFSIETDQREWYSGAFYENNANWGAIFDDGLGEISDFESLLAVKQFLRKCDLPIDFPTSVNPEINRFYKCFNETLVYISSINVDGYFLALVISSEEKSKLNNCTTYYVDSNGKYVGDEYDSNRLFSLKKPLKSTSRNII